VHVLVHDLWHVHGHVHVLLHVCSYVRLCFVCGWVCRCRYASEMCLLFQLPDVCVCVCVCVCEYERECH